MAIATLAIVLASLTGSAPASASDTINESMREDRVRFRLPAQPTGTLIGENEYLIPLTAPELEHLRSIDTDNEVASRAHFEFRADPSYGGSWFDRDSNTTKVAIVGSAANVRARFQALELNHPVEFVAARYSLAELRAMAEEASTYAIDSRLPFASISASVVDNAVRVTTPDVDRLELALQGVAPALVVQPGELFSNRACNTRSDCGPPFVGGLQLNRSSTTACSAGFVIGGAGSRGRVITTAGHCGSAGQVWWHHTSSNRVGTMYVRYMAGGGKVDVGFIDATDSQLTDDIYIHVGQRRDVSIYQQHGLDRVNDTVCVTGISDQKCGFMWDIGATVQRTDGTFLYDQYVVDYQIGGGTSGATSYRGNPATMLGAFWGGTSTHSVYSHQHNIVAKSGGSVLTSP